VDRRKGLILLESPPSGPRKHIYRLGIGRRVVDRASLIPEFERKESDGLAAHGWYRFPDELARHASKERFAPDELRAACRDAGEGLGKEDAREARFRSAAQMVVMWDGLDLPASYAPYTLRDARLGYIDGYTRTLVSGELPEERTARAAEARWGSRWREKLEAASRRAGA
jgi:hypothetical protein